MSSLTERGLLREMPCGANLAYILAQNVSVQPTEYKVMQNPNVNCLVSCMRMKETRPKMTAAAIMIGYL